jgi:hypothetical protein
MTGMVVSCCLVGCGRDDGPLRFDVSGKVTFNNKPVPVGRIQFEPDSSQDNQGPAGYALIKDGTYSTQETGKGTVGGPHVVVMLGFDGKAAPAEEIVAGAPLFPKYRTTVDLPKETTTMDFDVPAMESDK